MTGVSFAPADATLYTEIYQQLKRRACALRRGRHGNTLDTTALVHESFIKLVEMRARVQDRAHLFRLAALAMRQIFIDHLRERRAGKRGGRLQRVELTDLALPEDDPAHGLAVVAQALDQLRAVDQRMADVFSLRVFGGLEFEEIGAMLGNSRPTAQRDFQAARAWLLSAMSDADGPAGSAAVRHPIGRSGRE